MEIKPSLSEKELTTFTENSNFRETIILKVVVVQRSYPEIFFKLWETITCDLLEPKFKV